MSLIQWIKDRVPDWTGFCYSLHFFCSMLLVIFGAKLGLTRMQAVGAAVFIGLAKEIFDVVVRHKTGDLMDMVCNMCGAFVGWLMVH